MSRPLVVFGEDWGRHPSSTQHIIIRLAQTHDVIWVNSIGLRRPRLSLKDMDRVVGKLKNMGMSKPQTTIPQRMSVIAPHAISWPGNPLAAWFNRSNLSRQINAELKRRGLSNPIFWASLPSAIDVIKAYPNALLVYYCGDDFSALEGVDHKPVAQMEAELVEKADVVFVASEVLAQKFNSDKTHLLPHGVDLTLFQTAQPRPADLPKGKVVGFYGSLASWIDINAVAKTARLMPDWTFVLIGSERCDVSALRSCLNVVLLGEKPHSALPAYVQHWDLSLLPFKDTPQIRACNPLKLREYLGVGTPIVSPYFEALKPYQKLIEIAPYGDYRSAILRGFEDKQRNGLRRASVASESWEQRASDVMDILERLG